jgi:hypothetical protein
MAEDYHLILSITERETQTWQLITTRNIMGRM